VLRADGVVVPMNPLLKARAAVTVAVMVAVGDAA